MQNKCRSLVALVVLLAVWLAPASALAHATLVQAEPPAGIALDVSPAQVRLTFDEQVEADFSGIAVYDSTGARVDTGDSRVSPSNVQQVAVGLKSLPTGYYTVAWQVVSADGHRVKGAYTFAVGHPTRAAQSIDSALTQSPTWPAVGSVIWHLLQLIGLILLAGAALFRLMVLPAAAIAQTTDAVTVAAVVRLRQTAAWAAGLFFVAQAGLVVDQAATMTDSTALRPGLLWRVVAHTNWGRSWLAGLLAAALLIAFGIPAEGRRNRWRQGLGGILASTALFTLSLGGHAGAQVEGTTLAVLADWLHLLATASWVGGLLYLLLALFAAQGSPTERSQVISALVRRFSLVALVSVATLAVTGLYTALLRVPAWGALTGTPYGETLLVKVALYAGMVVLGAINLLLLSPRFRRLASEAGSEAVAATQRRFVRLVRLEISGGLAIMLAVAVLTSVAPARSVWVQPFDGKQAAGDLQVALHLEPNQPGWNRMSVQVADAQGRAPTDVQQVRLEFSMLEHDMGIQRGQTTPTGDGTYTLAGSQISMAGRWSIAVVVRRTGKEDVSAVFLVNVTDPSA